MAHPREQAMESEFGGSKNRYKNWFQSYWSFIQIPKKNIRGVT
jgi:hypothetical protein